MWIHTITVVLITIIELFINIIYIGECMPRNVHEISRIELLLKGRNAKKMFLFFVLINKLPNEIYLFIYNGMFFNQYTHGLYEIVWLEIFI